MTEKSKEQVALDAIRRGALAHADGDPEEAIRLLMDCLGEMVFGGDVATVVEVRRADVEFYVAEYAPHKKDWWHQQKEEE